ncbi:MAG: rhodanese-like domain-containing protein [Ardenticatenaceae bacterium]|nr:rhodanese-like domain-containing protein [Ardenticatenaceae bacterium]HBY94410.1 hypothetical protein [Chloroflexota bacterium]
MPVDITRDDVHRLVKDGAQLVEVLGREEYEGEHLRGAINIPLTTLDRETTAPLKQDRPMIVYCFDYQ